MDAVEKRANIKYLMKKGLTPKEIYKDLVRTLGKDAPSKPTVCRWINEFRFGRETVFDLQRSGRPKSATDEETVESVRSMVMKDRRVTVKHIADTLKISADRVWTIISKYLKMKKVVARWVPRLLTEDQKKTRVQMSRQNLALYEADEDTFLARFVTMDETWVHHFDPESKRQSMEWKHPSSPTPKKPKMAASAGKIMASVFWDSEGIIMIDYLAKGETVTSEYYVRLLHKLRAEIKSKRRGKLQKTVLFLQDNAPVHKAARSLAAIRENGFEVLEHPPYSPDLAPSDYFLFAHLKKKLRGTVHRSDGDIIEAVEGFFQSKNKTFYKTGIQALRKRWHQCITLKGEYVEE